MADKKWTLQFRNCIYVQSGVFLACDTRESGAMRRKIGRGGEEICHMSK